jgi:hypothetical protein
MDMFLEIKKHTGVDIEEIISPEYSIEVKIEEAFFINLSFVTEIYIGEQPFIVLKIHSGYREVKLNFTQEGMGEYQRLKRIIESQTLK